MPVKISSGASHDRSNDSRTVTSAVPTSAPSMTARAGAVPISPWPANDATISAVAVLLWIRPVTPSPAKNAEARCDTLLRSTRRRSPPYRRRMPVRTMCVPQTRRETTASRFSSVGIRSASPWQRRGSPWQRVSLGIREGLHRFLHALLVSQPGIFDTAEGREFQPVAGDFAHIDCPHMQFAHQLGDVVETV